MKPIPVPRFSVFLYDAEGRPFRLTLDADTVADLLEFDFMGGKMIGVETRRDPPEFAIELYGRICDFRPRKIEVIGADST